MVIHRCRALTPAMISNRRTMHAQVTSMVEARGQVNKEVRTPAHLGKVLAIGPASWGQYGGLNQRSRAGERIGVVR